MKSSSLFSTTPSRTLGFSPSELNNIHIDSNIVYTNNDDGKNIFIYTIPDKLKKEIVSQNDNDPSCGWIAPGYGCKVKAPIVKYITEAILPIDIASNFGRLVQFHHK